MDHSVRLTERAYDQIDGIVGHISLDSPDAAQRWRDRLLHEIGTLRYFPLRHGLAPEAQAVGVDVHQMMFGAYRILYAVDEHTVTVHGVRHGARRPLLLDELPRPN